MSQKLFLTRLASASRQPPSTSSKISKASGEERRLSYDTLRNRHNTSEQEKELNDEEDEANKADDEGEAEGKDIKKLWIIHENIRYVVCNLMLKVIGLLFILCFNR